MNKEEAWDKLQEWLDAFNPKTGPYPMDGLQGIIAMRDQVQRKMHYLLLPTSADSVLATLEKQLMLPTFHSEVARGRVWLDRDEVLDEVRRKRREISK